jgi:hypothetical protein
MKTNRIAAVLAVMLAYGTGWTAPPENETEQLRRQLDELQRRFERVQAEQRREIEALKQRLETLNGQQPPARDGQVSTGQPAEQAPNRPERVPGTEADRPAVVAPSPQAAEAKGWSPSTPIRLQRGSAYMDLGLVGTFAVGGSTADDIPGGTQLGGHDPNQRGFTVQGVEASFSGAVDPYFAGNANVLFQVDADGESNLELEEAWLETLSLPGGLQARAGQIYTEFGRQNPTHPHTWAFVDTPLVLGRFFGPDGLRNPGGRLAWLMPTPFYSELMFAVQDSHGETASSFRSSGHSHGHEDHDAAPFAYRHADNDRGVEHLEDMLFSSRYAVSFDLSDTQVLLLGASGALGPNSRGGEEAGRTTSQILGADLTWKWKSASHHAGFPFVSFQTEVLLRRYDAGAFDWDENGDGVAGPGEIIDLRSGAPALLGGEILTDYGFYSQLLYGFRPGWVAGLRFDYVSGQTADYEGRALALDGALLERDPQRAQRWRLSPNLTWYPSEFSKLRLQYNYDDRLVEGVDHSVWLQFEFLLGAHAAHKF